MKKFSTGNMLRWSLLIGLGGGLLVGGLIGWFFNFPTVWGNAAGVKSAMIVFAVIGIIVSPAITFFIIQKR